VLVFFLPYNPLKYSGTISVINLKGEIQMQKVLEKMKEDICLRGLSENTLKQYVDNARLFLEFTNKPVQGLDEQDIRTYLNYLISTKKLSPSSVNTYNAAIRFLFFVTLNRSLNLRQIPLQKKNKKLPIILTRDEISTIINGCINLKHKAMLMLAYSAGLRASEVANLRICDIDSKEMRIFVNCGKGGKDRFTLLSHVCLDVLRQYWKAYHPSHPSGLLFLGALKVSHTTYRSVEFAFNEAVKRVGITKNVSIHTLRHCFATHLLEDGTSILQIKQLLGHSCIQSTTIYLHLANLTAGIKSPLDCAMTGDYNA